MHSLIHAGIEIIHVSKRGALKYIDKRSYHGSLIGGICNQSFMVAHKNNGHMQLYSFICNFRAELGEDRQRHRRMA